MQRLTSSTGDSVQLLLFRTQRHLCGLPLAYIVETMRPLPMQAIASAPIAVPGMAIIRGEPLPVVDLGTLLDDGAGAAARFVIVRTGERRVALAVASVVGLRSFSAETFGQMPPLFSEADGAGVAAVGTHDTDLLLVLNSAHLVPESVWAAIDATKETSGL